MTGARGEKRVAIFGGAFDPPHFGHALNISHILNSGLVSEVWIVPSGERNDKVYNSSPADRLTMIERFVRELFPGNSKVRVRTEQLEEKLPGSFTIDLLRFFAASNPEVKPFFVIGSELIKDLPKWKEGPALIKEGSFLVVERPGERSKIQMFPNMISIPNRLGLVNSVSSTAVRDMTKNGEVLSGVVPSTVAAYIREHRLYAK